MTIPEHLLREVIGATVDSSEKHRQARSRDFPWIWTSCGYPFDHVVYVEKLRKDQEEELGLGCIFCHPRTDETRNGYDVYHICMYLLSSCYNSIPCFHPSYGCWFYSCSQTVGLIRSIMTILPCSYERDADAWLLLGFTRTHPACFRRILKYNQEFWLSTVEVKGKLGTIYVNTTATSVLPLARMLEPAANMSRISIWRNVLQVRSAAAVKHIYPMLVRDLNKPP